MRPRSRGVFGWITFVLLGILNALVILPYFGLEVLGALQAMIILVLLMGVGVFMGTMQSLMNPIAMSMAAMGFVTAVPAAKPVESEFLTVLVFALFTLGYGAIGRLMAWLLDR